MPAARIWRCTSAHTCQICEVERCSSIPKSTVGSLHDQHEYREDEKEADQTTLVGGAGMRTLPTSIDIARPDDQILSHCEPRDLGEPSLKIEWPRSRPLKWCLIRFPRDLGWDSMR